MPRKNCWEVKQCGRQAGGERITENGECPASNCFKAHHINNGINGGRACWAIAGTHCGGTIQGSFVNKMKGCANCDFFHMVQQEEGDSLMPVYDILAKVR